MKSSPYKLNGKLFRYNFDTCIVEYIMKADKDDLEADEEWKRTHGGRSLFGIGSDTSCARASVANVATASIAVKAAVMICLLFMLLLFY